MSGAAFTVGAGTPGLDGASTSRRLARFRPPRAHINSLIAASGRTVLDRARYLVRNNAYVANACEYWASQLVGDGIVPAWRTTDRALKRALSNAFLFWTDESDADGVTDFYGQQLRGARELFIAGEFFLRQRDRRPEDGLSVPLQYQMLPSEMLPPDDNRTAANGNEIRQGVEFDAIGRRVAYHFYRRHPDDSTHSRGASNEQVRVPADQVLHVMDPVEAGQIRGLSRIAPAIVKAWLLDLYDDAELDRKRTTALHVGWVKSPATLDEDTTGAEDQGDGTGDLVLMPGAMFRLAPGEDMGFNGPADVGGSYEAFQFRNTLALAAALGVPYAALTGDYSKANYSSERAAGIAFRRRASATQHRVLVHQMCRPIGIAWFRAAVLASAIRGFTPQQLLAALPEIFPLPWQPPKWETVDPQKDQRADAEEVAAGLASRQSKIRARGEDPERVDAERAEDLARERRLGLPSATPPAAPPSDQPNPDAAGDGNPNPEAMPA